MKPVHLSDGCVWLTPCIQIWEDLHTERSGYYRAFECEGPGATTGVPLIGYCSPGGSHKTIRAAVAEAKSKVPDAEIYRNGRRLI